MTIHDGMQDPRKDHYGREYVFYRHNDGQWRRFFWFTSHVEIWEGQ